LTSLSIDDSADPTARNATLGNTSLSALAPADISWVPADINNLNVSAGSGGNTFTVLTTPDGVAAAQATLNTGTGNDTVNVRATQRRLTINGQSGRDQVQIGNQGNVQGIAKSVSVTNAAGSTALAIDDSADPTARTATLTATLLQNLAPGEISWLETSLNALVLKGGTGGNTFNVNNTPRNNVPVATTLLTGAGNDTVNVRAANGPLTINGQAGDDRIKFYNFADAATIDGGPGNDTMEVAQGTLSTSQVPFTNVENVAVTGGSTLNVNTDIATGTVLVQQGMLALRGGIPTVTNRVDIQPQGILTGTGQVNGNVSNGGRVVPAGAGTVGRITVSDDYTQVATGNLDLDLQDPEPGTQSDNLEVGHAVRLGGALNLTALAGFNGDTFVLVSNRGGNDVAGLFAGLPEGTVVAVGGRRFQITYRGGDGHDVVLQPVGQVGTATTIGSSVNPSVLGQPVSFTATVTATAGTPTGVVTFMDGTTVLGTAPLNGVSGNDQATLSTPALAVGSHPITAVYGGDGAFGGSTSPALTEAVNPADTTLTVSSTTPVSVAGQAVNFTSTLGVVAPGAFVVPPTGTITFFDTFQGNTTVLATFPVGGSGTSPAFTAAGTHVITATYSGDGNFNGCTSAPITQVIVAAAATSLRLVPAQDTVYPGVPFAITVTALDPYNNVADSYQGTVHFTCSDPQGSVPGDGTFTAADNGVHTFDGFVLRTPADQTFTATDAVAPSITGTIYFQFHSGPAPAPPGRGPNALGAMDQMNPPASTPVPVAASPALAGPPPAVLAAYDAIFSNQANDSAPGAPWAADEPGSSGAQAAALTTAWQGSVEGLAEAWWQGL
jgi:hypothetical protein